MSDWPFKNFSREEMACKHCGKEGIKPEFMERLQQLRTAYNAPMPISSAYRCPDHPVERRKGSQAPGTHTQGIAADIAVQGAEAHRLLSIALQFGFKGIGVQQKGEGRFIHLDLRDKPAIWSY